VFNQLLCDYAPLVERLECIQFAAGPMSHQMHLAKSSLSKQATHLELGQGYPLLCPAVASFRAFVAHPSEMEFWRLRAHRQTKKDRDSRAQRQTDRADRARQRERERVLSFSKQVVVFFDVMCCAGHKKHLFTGHYNLVAT